MCRRSLGRFGERLKRAVIRAANRCVRGIERMPAHPLGVAIRADAAMLMCLSARPVSSWRATCPFRGTPFGSAMGDRIALRPGAWHSYTFNLARGLRHGWGRGGLPSSCEPANRKTRVNHGRPAWSVGIGLEVGNGAYATHQIL